MGAIKRNHVLSIPFFLIAMIGYSQCPVSNGCYSRIQVNAYCLEDDRSVLDAVSDGFSGEWLVISGDSANISHLSRNQIEVRPVKETIYAFRSLHYGTNLIPYGHFDTPVVKFASDYTFKDSAEGGFRFENYTIVSNPSEVIPAFVTRTDHTGNHGYMLLVDGSKDTSMAFYIDTVFLTAGTSYTLNFYAANIHKDLSKEDYNTAIIGIYIDDLQIYVDTLPHDTVWVPFKHTWIANQTGKATIKLRGLRGTTKENDFVVDDLSLKAVFSSEDQLKLKPCNTFQVFSPDGDGLYDAFYIKEPGIAKIYNPQGSLVRELSTPAHWDGRNQTGEMAPTDYYTIIVNEQKVLRVTLMR